MERLVLVESKSSLNVHPMAPQIDCGVGEQDAGRALFSLSLVRLLGMCASRSFLSSHDVFCMCVREGLWNRPGTLNVGLSLEDAGLPESGFCPAIKSRLGSCRDT